MASKKILVVDDEPKIIQAVSAYLEKDYVPGNSGPSSPVSMINFVGSKKLQ